jgi:hypothetical protein
MLRESTRYSSLPWRPFHAYPFVTQGGLNDAVDVGKLLDDIKIVFWEFGPLGFTVGRDHEMRIERGSGIAGRGDFWAVVDIKTGERTKAVSRRTDLRRLIIEWLAGPRPVRLPAGQSCYAKLHHNRFGSHYIWAIRRGLKRKEIESGVVTKRGASMGILGY